MNFIDKNVRIFFNKLLVVICEVDDIFVLNFDVLVLFFEY